MHNLNKVKILHITQVGGGIRTYIEQIIQNIDTDNFEIILACPKDRTDLIEMAELYNIKVHEIDLVWNISPISDFRNIYSIASLVKKIKPNIVHAHSSKAGMIVRLAGIFYSPKTLYTPNAYAYLGHESWQKKLFLSLEKLAIPITDMLLAASKSEAKRSLEDLSFPPQKVDLYPNSIEIVELTPKHTVQHKLVTTVGRLANQKNPLMFLRVCKLVTTKHDDIHFQIIGAGFEDQLRKQIDEYIKENHLEDKITIISWMSRKKLLETIRNVNVFVMTSKYESYGYVAAEAQMLEVPVVATNVDGLNEIIEDNKTGYLIESNDDEKMAEKIIYLIQNPSQADTMGKNGRKRIMDLFDIKKNIKILESIYRKYAVK
jgi:glycosyltransferase involved in cell wall biosynthesis